MRMGLRRIRRGTEWLSWDGGDRGTDASWHRRLNEEEWKTLDLCRSWEENREDMSVGITSSPIKTHGWDWGELSPAL